MCHDLFHWMAFMLGYVLPGYTFQNESNSTFVVVKMHYERRHFYSIFSAMCRQFTVTFKEKFSLERNMLNMLFSSLPALDQLEQLVATLPGFPARKRFNAKHLCWLGYHILSLFE